MTYDTHQLDFKLSSADAGYGSSSWLAPYNYAGLNPYKVPIDFVSLANYYPPLRPHVSQTPTGSTIDFHDGEAQRKLTAALLARDFGLSFTLREDRLCPPLPNRLNYILWIEDILRATTLLPKALPQNSKGIDIGTGASAIYPLLGCRTNPGWSFIATDIDDGSLHNALLNVQANDLQDRISVLNPGKGAGILAPIFELNESFDFTMCNPPFYESRNEMSRLSEMKVHGPNAVCMGTDTELITSGGEIAFVRRMIEESAQLGTRCRWYTSMLCKLSTVNEIVKDLIESTVSDYAITEFTQGQTRRWAIGWTFTDEHLPDSVSRTSHPTLQKLLPPTNTLRRTFKFSAVETELQELFYEVTSTISGVSVQHTVRQDDQSTVVDVLARTSENGWSRAARRKSLTTKKFGEGAVKTETALVCRLRCLVEQTVDRSHAPRSVTVVIDWVRGVDRKLFESLSNHVWRKFEAALGPPPSSRS